MPIPTETGAAFRVRIPAVLVRGATSPTKLEPRLGADAVGSAPATYKLLAPDGSEVASGSATVTSGVLSYTVPALDLPATLGFGSGYREVWTVTVSGVVQTATRPAVLARYPLHCPVTQADLENEYPDIARTLRISAESAQGFIDAAWEDTVRRMLQDGMLPESAVDVDALVGPVRNLALAKLFRFKSSEKQPGSREEALASHHEQAYRADWTRMRTRTDLDQDGNADSEDRVGMLGVISRGSPSAYTYRSGGYMPTRGRVL